MTAVWIRTVYAYRYHRICTAKYTNIHNREKPSKHSGGLGRLAREVIGQATD